MGSRLERWYGLLLLLLVLLLLLTATARWQWLYQRHWWCSEGGCGLSCYSTRCWSHYYHYKQHWAVPLLHPAIPMSLTKSERTSQQVCEPCFRCFALSTLLPEPYFTPSAYSPLSSRQRGVCKLLARPTYLSSRLPLNSPNSWLVSRSSCLIPPPPFPLPLPHCRQAGSQRARPL